MFVVTGAQGFIGSRMVSYLNSIGIRDIVVIDDIHADHRLGVNGVNYINLQNCHISCVHPISIDALDILPDREIRGVFHFGAISNTLEKDDAKIAYYNVRYTETLNRVCRNRNIPMMFSSTAAVYGNGNGPMNKYAQSKLDSELAISDHAVCFRLFNVYGLNEHHKGRMASVMFKWFNELKQRGKIHIFENSDTYMRDFIYVDDVCKVAYNSVANYKPGVYDLGSGTSVSFEEVADTAIDLLGIGTKEYIPMSDDLKSQYQTNTKANTDLVLANGWMGTEKFMSVRNGMENYYSQLTHL